jgi:hypothetical protein
MSPNQPRDIILARAIAPLLEKALRRERLGIRIRGQPLGKRVVFGVGEALLQGTAPRVRSGAGRPAGSQARTSPLSGRAAPLSGNTELSSARSGTPRCSASRPFMTARRSRVGRRSRS